MKILYFHQYFNTPEMSGGTRSYEMARRLVAAGHEVHMITSWVYEADQTDWYTTNETGIHVHWFPNCYNNKMSYLDRIKAFFRFAYHAAKKGKIFKDVDIVFATSTPLTIALPAVLTAKKLNVPMVFEVRDLWPELPIAMGALRNKFTQKLAYILESWAYKNSESIIALSPGMKDGIVKTGYPYNKVAVIPNSSDNELFEVSHSSVEDFRSKFNWLGDRKLVVYTGTFGIINGVSYLVDLAEKVYNLDSEVRFLLIGSGAEFELVKKYAEEKGILNINLFIMNSIPKKEIPIVLKAATLSTALFIDKPEMRANSANKFFDSLAAGTPILINYGGWMVDIIEHNNCGLVVWNKTIEQAAVELVEFVGNESQLAQAASNAKKLAQTQFDRDNLAIQFSNVLDFT
ncbi:MAG: glycosyltransferase family 4 protein, partial [Bacilli bacterium]